MPDFLQEGNNYAVEKARMNTALDAYANGNTSGYEIHMTEESTALANKIFTYVYKLEHGKGVPRSLWGMPQAVIWSMNGQLSRIKLIGQPTKEGRGASIDASALTPLNVSVGRLHDLTTLKRTYASTRFRILYTSLRGELGDAYAINMAAVLSTPRPILDRKVHYEDWRTGFKYSLGKEDFYPIELIISGNGIVRGNITI